MTYNTGNPVPSTDPRDLDDNSQAFDRFMQSAATQEPDRLGVPRLTWSYVEAAATALVNPNVIGLASLTSGQYKVPMFNNSSGAMVTFDTGALGRTLAGLANTTAGQLAGRTALNAVGVGDNVTGSAAKLATARGIAATGDATWSVSFDGSADATASLTLAATGVSAGTYTRVTVDTKGRVTAGSTSALPVANGGTGSTTAATARTALGSAASGANSDITSLAGLTTALSVAQGGTGATSGTAARTNLSAAASGANSDITSLTALTSLSRGTIAVKTANFTVATTESWILCNGSATLTATLPDPAAFIGRELMFKTIAAQTVVSATANVAPLVGGTVSTSILTAAAGKWATLVSNGTNWVIMQAN